MNAFRAKRIADQFATVGAFQVKNRLQGVTISYRDYHAYFEDEKNLWAFLFHIAHACHQESIVAEAEARLIA